jgi:acetoin utilization deacetylase AcuC-like enzyme
MRYVDHDDLNARVGAHSFSSDTPITAGTWKAAYRGVQATLTALDHVEGGAFALTRPPGHHAQSSCFGGYSYLNNAAVAAQAAVEAGQGRVCVLDVDFHHGNGTQEIFYDRADVLTVSVHGDPRTSFPYFSGYEDEIGVDEGEGVNLNLPLPAGTVFAGWSEALSTAFERIARHAPALLVVPLGVDTFEGDPISSFGLKTPDYLEMGRMIASLKLPTLFTMEGGYDVGPIGENVANVLEGFDGAT